MKPETQKPLEENIGDILHVRDVGKNFNERIQFTLELRPIVDKWHFMKQKSYAQLKKQSTRQIGNPQNQRIFASYASNRGYSQN